MYNQKLVASIKANHKILREFKDTVYVPFASEYSILIKNLNTVRAVVNVFIDGENQTPGGLVVDAGREVELERGIKNGNLTEGNRFKFIERTGAVEQHRGITSEDGIVRIEYQFEQRQVFAGSTNHYINNLSSYPGVTDKFTLTASGSIGGSTNVSQMNVGGALRGIDLSANGSAMAQAASASVSKYCADNGIKNLSSELHDGMATMDSYNDAGITVPGSRSTQKFSTTYMGPLESEKHTIVLKLLGETPDNKPVLKPVTVKTKPKCTSCGKQNKATAKFCTECGTALEIFA
jgi:hypothetical protein